MPLAANFVLDFWSVKGGGGGGDPPFPLSFFPLTFRKNRVRGGPGGGYTPLMIFFRDWGF